MFIFHLRRSSGTSTTKTSCHDWRLIKRRSIQHLFMKYIDSIESRWVYHYIIQKTRTSFNRACTCFEKETYVFLMQIAGRPPLVDFRCGVSCLYALISISPKLRLYIVIYGTVYSFALRLGQYSLLDRRTGFNSDAFGGQLWRTRRSLRVRRRNSWPWRLFRYPREFSMVWRISKRTAQ